MVQALFPGVFQFGVVSVIYDKAVVSREDEVVNVNARGLWASINFIRERAEKAGIEDWEKAFFMKFQPNGSVLVWDNPYYQTAQ